MRVLTRINPKGACDITLSSSQEQGEVELNGRRWLVDRCLDEVALGDPASGVHGSQEQVWEAVAPLLETPSSATSVLALGGHFSGKSFTLFGDDTEETRGLVFRYIESIFAASAADSTYALLSMFIIDADEAIVDVFDAHGCRRHSFQGNLATIPSLGPRALPVLPRIFSDRMRCEEALRMGLLACSLHRSRLLPLCNRSQLIVQLSHFHRETDDNNSPMKTVTFAEISSLELLPDPSLVDDRLAGATIRNISARTLREMLTTRSFLKSSSVLSYLLHDTLTSVILKTWLTYCCLLISKSGECRSDWLSSVRCRGVPRERCYPRPARLNLRADADAGATLSRCPSTFPRRPFGLIGQFPTRLRASADPSEQSSEARGWQSTRHRQRR